MPYINDIFAREILDSRGNPTIEVEVSIESGYTGRFSVPSGASTGSYEALELRDNNLGRYLGKGVQKAIDNVMNVIAPEIIGFDCRNQIIIDETLKRLDGTKTLEHLGANAILATSGAIAQVAAQYLDIPLYQYFGGFFAHYLPTPMMNILNGGKHAKSIDIQEIMIVPVKAKSFKHAVQIGAEIFHNLKFLLEEQNLSTTVGDEGGFAPQLNSNEEGIKLVVEAVKKAGYIPGVDVYLALDVASSELFNKNTNKYVLKQDNLELSSNEMVDYLENLVSKYPIISIEDGMAENDWNGWKLLTKRLGKKIQLVGDDLFVTNPERLKKGIKEQVANAVLVKMNQIGTISDTLKTIELAKRAGYATVISHRSGETEDTMIADLSVGVNALQIKTGSLSRTDRTAKYNQLIRIEDELQEASLYAGISAFKNK